MTTATAGLVPIRKGERECLPSMPILRSFPGESHPKRIGTKRHTIRDPLPPETDHDCREETDDA